MGEIITFYSYKGGVGRTMALANIATLMSQWGYNVLIVDWDLEAPGLEFFFQNYVSISMENVLQKEGVLDLLYKFLNGQLDATQVPDLEGCLIEINVPDCKTPLHFLTAGKRDAEYTGRVSSLDLEAFYEQDGGYFLETLREHLKQTYDFVLIDSRTGITDIGGICTIQLPDILVLLFTATEQSLQGIVNIAQKTVVARQNLPVNRLSLLCLPVPCRFDDREEFELSKSWLKRFSEELSMLYEDWLPDSVNIIEVLTFSKIPYMSYFSFGEKLPVLEQGTVDTAGLGYAYENLASLLVNKLQRVEQLVSSREDYVRSALIQAGVIKTPYPIPFELQKKIVELLTSLPEIHEINYRKALTAEANLDSQLENQIDFTGSTLQFTQSLVFTLVNYGELEDGRDPLEELLKATKGHLGQDRSEYCDTLIQELNNQENLIELKPKQTTENEISYSPSIELTQKIVNFIQSLPNINDISLQRALIYAAGLDRQLQEQIVFDEPSHFSQLLVLSLSKYGKLADGRDALEAILETSKGYIGQDRKEYCDKLIQDWKTFRQKEREVSARIIPNGSIFHINTSVIAPRHLPPLDAYFVNRKQELATLLDELHPGKVVTICGPGGIGKTALAAQAVHQIEPERFPDGILFHSFYSQPDSDLALEYIARTFEVEPKPTPAIAAKLALSGKRALLILDGAEEADDLRVILNVRDQCGVLITSRSKSDVLQIRHDLSPLDDESALDLIQAWGGSHIDNDNASRRICDVLGGLPLAIRLVGYYLQETGETAAEYLDWLEAQPFEALDHGNRRNESVAMLLSRGVEQVSDNAQKILSIIGLLAFAPFVAEPIAIALECDTRSCRSGLGELVKSGLLLRSGNRYEVNHALIHTYAREKMTVGIETLQRLATHYTSFAKIQSQNGVDGYKQLDSERAHILRVIEHCKEKEAWKTIIDLVEAIDTYLDRQGHWIERLQSLKIKLIAVKEQEEHGSEGFCLNDLGTTYFHLGDYETALQYLEQSLSIQQEIADRNGEGATLNNLSQIFKVRGDYATALQYLEQSLAIRRECGDRVGEGMTLNNLATTAYARGDYATALTYLEQSLAIQQEIRDKAGEGTTLNNIGQIYNARGDYATALTYLEQSLTIQREIGDKADEGRTLNNIGLIYDARGEYAKALNCLEQSLTIFQEIGDNAGEGNSLNNLSQIYWAQGNYETALQYVEQSLAIQQEIGNKADEGMSLHNIGIIYYALGRIEEAISYYEQALAISQEIGDRRSEGNELGDLGRAYNDLGQIEKAIACSEQALKISQEIKDRHGEGISLYNLGLIYVKLGGIERSTSYLHQALSIFETLQSPYAETTRHLLGEMQQTSD